MEVFSFHLARLDLRQESSRVEKTVAEVLALSGEDYLRLDEAGKAGLLRRLLCEPDRDALPENLSSESRGVLETFANIRRTAELFSGWPSRRSS